jgi:hypothetical protein
VLVGKLKQPKIKGAQGLISGGCGSVSVLLSPSSSDLRRVAGTRGLVLVVWDLPEGETFVDTELTALSK